MDSLGRRYIDFKVFRNYAKENMPEDVDKQVAGLVEAFKVYNRSGNGLITAKELTHVLSSLGHQITEDEAREVISQFDVDSNGGLSYEEFVQLSKSS